MQLKFMNSDTFKYDGNHQNRFLNEVWNK